MVTCEKVQNTSLRRAGYAYIQLLTVAIGEPLGDSIQRGSRMGGRGYLDK